MFILSSFQRCEIQNREAFAVGFLKNPVFQKVKLLIYIFIW